MIQGSPWALMTSQGCEANGEDISLQAEAPALQLTLDNLLLSNQSSQPQNRSQVTLPLSL